MLANVMLYHTNVTFLAAGKKYASPSHIHNFLVYSLMPEGAN